MTRRKSPDPSSAPVTRREEEEEERPRLEQGWRMVGKARELFAEALPAETLSGTWRDPRRTFSAVDYLSLLLIGLFNPSVRSLRGLCHASKIERVRLQWGCGPLSLASTPDAQHLIDPEKLRPVVAALHEKVRALDSRREGVPGTPSARAREAGFVIHAMDSTVFKALPRMLWAVYGGGRPRADGRRATAVRFHLSFDTHASSPANYAVTAGGVCERHVWEHGLSSGEPEPDRPDSPGGKAPARPLTVGDRYYGGSFALLERLTRSGTRFLVRMTHEEHPEVVEELPVTEEDRAAGVVRQAWVHLGKTPRREDGGKDGGKDGERTRVRILWLERIVLATDLPPEVLPAALASGIYRERWEVEFFFKWIKCLLGCRHWLAESRKGVTLQLYLVLIAGLLLQWQCGRRPTRRMMELLQFYFQGMVTAQELGPLLARAAAEAETARKSKRLYAQKKAVQKT